MWLFCARSVLRGRFAVGVGIGAGVAVIDAAYGALGLAGAAMLLAFDPLRIGLGAAGASLLAYMGLRTLSPLRRRPSRRLRYQAAPSSLRLWDAFRVRLGGETAEEVRSLSLARRRFGRRLLVAVDAVSGTALLAFAGLLGWRVLREG